MFFFKQIHLSFFAVFFKMGLK